MQRGNGGVIGKVNTPTSSSAKGIWSLNELQRAVLAGTWPVTQYTVVQTFTATSTWTCPTGVTEVEYLVVAGGGGGGGDTGGGGGAGGFRTASGFSVTAGTDYTITVGGGGSGGCWPCKCWWVWRLPC